jgi:hypothetical protein
MCWNSTVSLNTFIFGVISMIIIMAINQIEYKYLLLPFVVTSMQLLEYFAWENINNKQTIALLSLFGLSLILLQLLIINITILKGNELIIVLILLLLGSLAILLYDVNNNKLRMEKGINGHLVWHWADIPIPLLVFILSFYFYVSLRNINASIVSPMALILLIISMYSYYKYKTWGSMWCYYSNVIWILLIGYSLIKLYKSKIEK